MRFNKQSFIKYDPVFIIRIIAVCWIITKLMCYKLWLADRSFPLVPVNEVLLATPNSIHYILFFASLFLMTFLLYSPGKKIAFLLVIIELATCLFDQNRWQPWEYQFIFMLAAYAVVKAEDQTRFGWQVIITGLYFFSGLSKWNASFIHDIWGNLIFHQWLGINVINTLVYRIGYIIPFLEIFFAGCLFFTNTRKIAVLFFCMMHLLNLIMLGPAGLNFNAIIWPWNIVMCLLVFQLFYEQPFNLRISGNAWAFSSLVMLFWWILPFLGLAGKWDNYLSFKLYSGGIQQMYICTEYPETRKALAPYAVNNKLIPCSSAFSLYKWGIAEMNIVPYPEKRVYKSIVRQLQKRFPTDTTMRFYLYKSGFANSVIEMH